MARCPTRAMQQTGWVLRASLREDLGSQDVPEADDRGPDAIADRRGEAVAERGPVGRLPFPVGVRERFQERPRLDFFDREIVDLLDDLEDAGADGDPAPLKSAPEVRDMVLQVRGHGAPSGADSASIDGRPN